MTPTYQTSQLCSAECLAFPLMMLWWLGAMLTAAIPPLSHITRILLHEASLERPSFWIENPVSNIALQFLLIAYGFHPRKASVRRL